MDIVTEASSVPDSSFTEMPAIAHRGYLGVSRGHTSILIHFIFLRFIYFVLCMSILSVCLSMDYLHVWSLWRSERVWDPLVLMCGKLGTIMWALGIKFGSSEKSTSAFKCGAISPVQFSACSEIVYCKDNSKGVMLSHGVIFKMHIP